MPTVAGKGGHVASVGDPALIKLTANYSKPARPAFFASLAIRVSELCRSDRGFSVGDSR